MKNVEDVVHASANLHIRFVLVHDVTTFGELHEHATTLVGCKIGIVLVGQRTPQDLHANELTPLQFLDERNAVEQFAVHVPRHFERSIAVVEELHVVDEVERLVFKDVGKVGHRHDEQRIGHLVPLCASLDAGVNLSPVHRHPKPLVELGFGKIIVVLPAEDAVESHRVLQAEDRGIEVDGPSVLLGVNKRLTRCIAKSSRCLSIAHIRLHLAVELLESDVAHGLSLFGLSRREHLEAPLLLELESQFLLCVEEHLVDFSHLERSENVVLIGLDELVGRQRNVVRHRERERLLGELARQIFLLVERIDDVGTIIIVMGVETVRIIALQEEMWVEVGGGLGTTSQTESVVEVVGDDGVDGADIHQAGMLLRTCLHEVLDESLCTEYHILEAFQVLQPMNKLIHRTFSLRELHLSVFVPELLVLHLRVGIFPDALAASEQCLRKFVECIVGTPRGTHDNGLCKRLQCRKFHHHIVDREHPLTVFQLHILLGALHVVHPVHTALLWNGKLASLHLIGRVVEHVELSSETEVLLVVGDEVKMHATVFSHIHRVGDIETVEGDGIFADRAGERVLEHANLILVDVHIGKDVLQNDVDDVACLEQFVHTCGILTLDDALFAMRVFAVELLCDGFVNGNGKNQLAIIGAHLDVVEQPRMPFEHARF